MGKIKTALGYAGRLVPYLGEYLTEREIGHKPLRLGCTLAVLLLGSVRAYALALVTLDNIIHFEFPQTSLIATVGYAIVTASNMVTEIKKKPQGNLEKLVTLGHFKAED